MDNKKIYIEVVYALSNNQRIIKLALPEGSTVEAAIQDSGILNEFPDIDLTKQKVGIFSRLRELGDVLKDGDRLEIYRPLCLDPKDSRRAKAKRKGKSSNKP